MRAFPSTFCPRFLFLILSFCSALGLAHAQVPKIGTDTTLDIVTWNIEWFGDSLNGPSDEVTQLKNVSEVIASMDMDIISLCEVSNPDYWQKLQNNLPDYGAVITNYTQTQKTALLYRKTMFKLLYSKSILLAFDYEFASGRFPLEVALETQWGSKRDTVYIWVIHLKANTGTTAEKLSSYDRRAKAAEELKKYLDPKKRWKGWVMGDWNDDLDVSVVSGKASPFLAWRNDSNYVFPSYRLTLSKQRSTANYSEMIDHISCLPAMKSNWIVNQSGVMVGDAYIGNYRLNTSDHYPVWARFSMDFKAWVGVENIDLQQGEGFRIPYLLEVYDLQGRMLEKGDPSTVRLQGPGMYIFRYLYVGGTTKTEKVFVR